jgi:hypothetical protein
MAGKIQFTLKGEAEQYSGAVTGRGSLKLETDAASLSLALDYQSRDKVILTLSGSRGVVLSAGSKLKFSGSVSRDLVNRTWEGDYALKLEINQSVAASLSQQFTRVGTKTHAEITVRFSV